jgi:hypothetical protein
MTLSACLDDEPLEPASPFAESFAEALARSDRALRRGLVAHAQRWLKLAGTYHRLMLREEPDGRGEPEAAPSPAQQSAPETSETRSGHSRLHEVHRLQSHERPLAAPAGRDPRRPVFGVSADELRARLRRLRAPPDP